ncbi:outer membrane beta-barrel protein, partial [Hymenobacter agri]
GTRVPVQLVGGYQLRPRLALQLGLAYSGNTAHYAGKGYYASTASSSDYFDFDHTFTTRVLTVSALARYTLTANPAHRVQFDALGGLGLENGWNYSRGTQTDSLGGTRNTSSFSNQQAASVLLLTAGLGTRFRLSRHVELFYDFTLNRALTGEPPRPAPLGLTGSSALGVRYRFGH